MRLQLVCIFLLLPTLTPSAHAAPPATIAWDRATLTRVADGSYARMLRLRDGPILLSYEFRGRSFVKRSTDEGKTWSQPTEVAGSKVGAASNPETLQLDDGTLWLLWNERPRKNANAPFAIKLSISHDAGVTWTPADHPLYEGGTVWGDGCWEPAALQLPSGEIWLFFANEAPYTHSDEQEISLLRSPDRGRTWTPAQPISFRPHHRDGMPVPCLLKDGRIAIAIEDNGQTPDEKLMRPAIIRIDPTQPPQVVNPESPNRRPAVEDPIPPSADAGAPYLRALADVTILSCQSNDDTPERQMTVYLGDPTAQHFTARSHPFPTDPGKPGLWNSLFVKNQNTLTALSGTTINGKQGVWLIDGKLLPAEPHSAR